MCLEGLPADERPKTMAAVPMVPRSAVRAKRMEGAAIPGESGVAVPLSEEALGVTSSIGGFLRYAFAVGIPRLRKSS